MAIGVAPFEVEAPAGADVPDVASLLADRLATKGVERVVGPSALGAPAKADASSEDVRAWAAAAAVDAVVVGRATRVGSRVSLDARLRAGKSGATAATYVAEAPRADDLAGAVDRLASQIVEGWSAALGTPVADAPASTQSGGKRLRPDAPLSATGFDSKAPISINSSELEAIQDGNKRRFVFTGKVEVKQDNVSLTADRLDAYYPADSSQPDRLVASGHVVVTQDGKQARCDEATYVGREQRIFCRGNAELRQGDDRAQGKEIELQLDTSKMYIRGGAQIRIQPRDTEAKPAPTAGAAR
jgi:lipopolysaccharide transport protein LptA